jgi:hypothetical protein
MPWEKSMMVHIRYAPRLLWLGKAERQGYAESMAEEGSIHPAGSLPDDVFVTTHWSLIIQAGGVASQPAARAWDALARAYWSPLYRYARRRGYAHHEAEEMCNRFSVTFWRRMLSVKLPRREAASERFC